MRDTTPTVICIPAKPEVVLASKHQLRVAAYCRVSTDDEEQLTSYEAQKNYYTDKIMTNKEWTMAGIFADEGITGTSARKRPEFLRMIRQCKQGKIDIVLTKSIQTDEFYSLHIVDSSFGVDFEEYLNTKYKTIRSFNSICGAAAGLDLFTARTALISCHQRRSRSSCICR